MRPLRFFLVGGIRCPEDSVEPLLSILELTCWTQSLPKVYPKMPTPITTTTHAVPRVLFRGGLQRQKSENGDCRHTHAHKDAVILLRPQDGHWKMRCYQLECQVASLKAGNARLEKTIHLASERHQALEVVLQQERTRGRARPACSECASQTEREDEVLAEGSNPDPAKTELAAQLQLAQSQHAHSLGLVQIQQAQLSESQTQNETLSAELEQLREREAALRSAFAELQDLRNEHQALLLEREHIANIANVNYDSFVAVSRVKDEVEAKLEREQKAAERERRRAQEAQRVRDMQNMARVQQLEALLTGHYDILGQVRSDLDGSLRTPPALEAPMLPHDDAPLHTSLVLWGRIPGAGGQLEAPEIGEGMAEEEKEAEAAECAAKSALPLTSVDDDESKLLPSNDESKLVPSLGDDNDQDGLKVNKESEREEGGKPSVPVTVVVRLPVGACAGEQCQSPVILVARKSFPPGAGEEDAVVSAGQVVTVVREGSRGWVLVRKGGGTDGVSADSAVSTGSATGNVSSTPRAGAVSGEDMCPSVPALGDASGLIDRTTSSYDGTADAMGSKLAWYPRSWGIMIPGATYSYPSRGAAGQLHLVAISGDDARAISQIREDALRENTPAAAEARAASAQCSSSMSSLIDDELARGAPLTSAELAASTGGSESRGAIGGTGAPLPREATATEATAETRLVPKAVQELPGGGQRAAGKGVDGRRRAAGQRLPVHLEVAMGSLDSLLGVSGDGAGSLQCQPTSSLLSSPLSPISSTPLHPLPRSSGPAICRQAARTPRA